MATLFFREVQPMEQGGPIEMPNCSYRWLRLGPLLFGEMLPMPWGGPIAYAYAAADGYGWANNYFRKFC